MQTDDLIQMLSEDATPVKRLPGALLRAGKWLLGVIGVLVAGLAVIGLRTDVLERLADPMFLLESALITTAGMTAALAAFRLSRPDTEVGLFNKALILVSAGIWALLSSYCFYCSDPGTVAHSATSAHEAICLTEVVVFGLPAGALIFFMIRRAAPVHLAWAGLAASLAALSFSALGGRYTCENMEPAHVLVWHFIPVALLGFAGLWLGRKLFKW